MVANPLGQLKVPYPFVSLSHIHHPVHSVAATSMFPFSFSILSACCSAIALPFIVSSHFFLASSTSGFIIFLLSFLSILSSFVFSFVSHFLYSVIFLYIFVSTSLIAPVSLFMIRLLDLSFHCSVASFRTHKSFNFTLGRLCAPIHLACRCDLLAACTYIQKNTQPYVRIIQTNR